MTALLLAVSAPTKHLMFGFLYLDCVNGKAYKGFDTLLYDIDTDKQSIYDKERVKITEKPIDNTNALPEEKK